MNKIICDICGTSYQESADCCPICGCSRDSAAEFLGVELPAEELIEETAPVVGVFSSRNRKKEIFDYDEVNSDEADEEEDLQEEDYEEEEEEEEAPKTNTFVIILLTVLIIALLAGAGFIFIRYFLPNRGNDETVPVTTELVAETTIETTK